MLINEYTQLFSGFTFVIVEQAWVSEAGASKTKVGLDDIPPKSTGARCPHELGAVKVEKDFDENFKREYSIHGGNGEGEE